MRKRPRYLHLGAFGLDVGCRKLLVAEEIANMPNDREQGVRHQRAECYPRWYGLKLLVHIVGIAIGSWVRGEEVSEDGGELLCTNLH